MGFSLVDVSLMTPEERRLYIKKLNEELEKEKVSVESAKRTKRPS